MELRPVIYSYQHTGGKKERFVNINFDWDRQRIITRTGKSVWTMPIETGILDKLLYQLAIMYDLERGIMPEAYSIADGGKIKTYHFEYHGKETVNIPVGKFEAIKLERHKPNSKRKTFLWCAVKLSYLPIKVIHIEKDGSKTTAKLIRLTGL